LSPPFQERITEQTCSNTSSMDLIPVTVRSGLYSGATRPLEFSTQLNLLFHPFIVPLFVLCFLRSQITKSALPRVIFI